MVATACRNQVAAAGLADEITALEHAGVRSMTRTIAFGLYDHGTAGLLERVTDHLADPPTWLPRQRFWTLRAAYIVLATGAIERHLAFGNNDRPGVMTVAAARTYLNRFAVLPGERIVVATNNDSAYPAAAELANAGAAVRLLDARTTIPDQLRNSLASAEVDLHLGLAPLQARGASGVNALALAKADGAKWRAAGSMSCDLVLVRRLVAGGQPAFAPRRTAGVGCGQRLFSARQQ